MADIDITINICCDICGNGLKADWDWRKKVLNITPCQKCIDDAVKETKELE